MNESNSKFYDEMENIVILKESARFSDQFPAGEDCDSPCCLKSQNHSPNSCSYQLSNPDDWAAIECSSKTYSTPCANPPNLQTMVMDKIVCKYIIGPLVDVESEYLVKWRYINEAGDSSPPDIESEELTDSNANWIQKSKLEEDAPDLLDDFEKLISSNPEEFNKRTTYDLDKIVKIGPRRYQVKWLGYSAKDCTWEPIENIHKHFPNKVDEKLKQYTEEKTKEKKTRFVMPFYLEKEYKAFCKAFTASSKPKMFFETVNVVNKRIKSTLQTESVVSSSLIDS